RLQFLDQFAGKECELSAFTCVHRVHIYAFGRGGCVPPETKYRVDGKEAAIRVSLDLDVLRFSQARKALPETIIERHRLDIAPAQQTQRLGTVGALGGAQLAVIAEALEMHHQLAQDQL